MSILLRVAYDGTDYHGYARQPATATGAALRTVQGELERALEAIYKQPVATRAASRTDAGVHARGQLAAMEPPFFIPLDGLVLALASHLPHDMAVSAAWEETGSQGGPVNVRRDNLGKHYRYRIRCSRIRDPLSVRYEWHHPRTFDASAMERAASHFVGTHDFSSFRSSLCQAKTTDRTISAVNLITGSGAAGPLSDVRTTAVGPDWIEIHVHGSAFLYNMVRIMVGTIVEVGAGRREPDSIPATLRSGRRSEAGPTAPAHGLTLVEVRWPRIPDEGWDEG